MPAFSRLHGVLLTVLRFLALPTVSGVFRIWQRAAWRARGARAYNGGLEAEPLAGSRRRAPGGGGSGERSPPEAETLFASECSMETANSPIFLKFRNAKDHQTLLSFAILAGKCQKRTFSYKVACKKFSWSGQRGGIAPWPP